MANHGQPVHDSQQSEQLAGTWKRQSLIALFVLWLFASLGLYYLVQKPVTPAILAGLGATTWLPAGWSPAALARALLDLLTVLWLALIALGLGLRPRRWLRFDRLPALEQTLFAVGLGFGMMGLLTLALGLAGWLERGVLWGVAVVLTLVALPALPAHFARLRRPRPAPLPRLVALYLCLAGGLSLSLALLPPTGWDGLFYHLTGAKLYLAAGAIRPGIDLPHLHFPSLFQMLFLLAMGLRGDVAAQLLHFLFNLLLAGMVYALAHRGLGQAEGWTAVLFLYAMPMVLGLAAWPYNDLALAFYTVAAVYAFLIAERAAGRETNGPHGERAALVLSGLMCGLAMGLKYTSFVTPLALVGLLLWRRRADWRQAAHALLWFSLPALLVALPWYLKNWAFTGNPIYPFFFGGRHWNEFRALAYADPGTGIGLNPVALLILPASLSIGYDFVTGLQDASQDGLTGPMALALLPLVIWAVIVKGRSGSGPGWRVPAIVTGVHYLFWTAGVISSASLWQSRLLLPGLALLCPLLAAAVVELRRFDRPAFSPARFVRLTLGLALGLGLLGQLVSWLPAQPWAYLTGSESRAENLARRLGGHYAALTAVNQTLPPDAVVEMLWEPRSYYCARDCRPDSILDKLGDLVYRHGDAAGIAAAWRAAGVTHVLLWRDGLDYIVASGTPVDNPLVDLSMLGELAASHLELETAVGGYQLFRLTPAPQ